MLGLGLAAFGFTALVGYAVMWASQSAAIYPAEVGPVSVTLDDEPIDVAVLLAIDPGMRWVSLAEDRRTVAGGRQLIVSQNAGRTGLPVVRQQRRAGNVRLIWPSAHA